MTRVRERVFVTSFLWSGIYFEKGASSPDLVAPRLEALEAYEAAQR